MEAIPLNEPMISKQSGMIPDEQLVKLYQKRLNGLVRVNELLQAKVTEQKTITEQLIKALQRATKILKAWADNDIVSDDTLMEMTDEVIPMCDEVLGIKNKV